jgi:hypothetical protein
MFTSITYFQTCIIIFLQNYLALQFTSINAALVILNLVLKKIGVLLLKSFPHYRLHTLITAGALALQVFL